MAAFSYQQHYPFLLDSACFPDTPIDLPILSPQLEDMSNASSCLPYSDVIPHIVDAKNYESSSSLSQMTHSSVVVHPHGTEGTPQVPEGSMEKRKDRNEPCLSSVQSKDSKESKSKKQKKTSSGLKGKEEKKLKTTEKKGVKPCVEPATGYIHVRARRGQATDSHSLAERVRREKISERMKMLQSLVPGCDKWVSGKALLLDEIINYVRSLQKQVEFLSMKLASMNPLLYDFALDFVGHTKQPEELDSMSQPMPSVLQTNHFQLSIFEDSTNSLRMMETSLPVSLHGDGAIAFSQDNGSALMQVGDQRQSLLHQVVSKNMCFFQ